MSAEYARLGNATYEWHAIPGVYDPKPEAAPVEPTVRFTLPNGAAVEVRVAYGRLEVRSTHGGLVIRPEVTNAVTIWTEGRDAT